MARLRVVLDRCAAMDKAILVELDLKKGGTIVSALEDHGIRVAAALLVKFPEYEDWRLVLAAKKLDALDLGDAYLQVHHITRGAGLTVWETPTLFLMKTTDPFIRALRKTFGKAAGVVGMRVGGQSWGDRYIEDGVAYKIA
jgi:hypothetical protein